jgi:hypothetical protein
MVTEPVASQDYPFPATDVCASDGNSFRVETAIAGHPPTDPDVTNSVIRFLGNQSINTALTHNFATPQAVRHSE